MQYWQIEELVELRRNPTAAAILDRAEVISSEPLQADSLETTPNAEPTQSVDTDTNDTHARLPYG